MKGQSKWPIIKRFDFHYGLSPKDLLPNQLNPPMPNFLGQLEPIDECDFLAQVGPRKSCVKSQWTQVKDFPYSSLLPSFHI
jgi:hypothetical protein